MNIEWQYFRAPGGKYEIRLRGKGLHTHTEQRPRILKCLSEGS